MIKKPYILLLFLLLMLVLTACDTATNGDADNADQQLLIINPGINQEEQQAAESIDIAAAADEAVLDLSDFSSTMLYAEVYNIAVSPTEYLGRTIKLCGQYYADYYAETEQYYHYVVVTDNTSCCQQGLEFVWRGEHQYPDDYPPDGTDITLSGVFSSYEELGYTYYCLMVEEIS